MFDGSGVVKTVDQILDFIKSAHSGQYYGENRDYWLHSFAVAEMGKIIFDSDFTEDAYKMALLHDVVEDTKYTLQDLIDLGVEQSVVSGVELLTKNNKLTYEENINRIVKSANKNALMVKIADNVSNLTSSMEALDPIKKERLISKYSRSLILLSKAL